MHTSWRNICRPKEAPKQEGELPCLCCGGSGFIRDILIRKHLLPEYQQSDYPWVCRAENCTAEYVKTAVPDKGTVLLPRVGVNAAPWVISTLPDMDWGYLRQTTQSQWVAATLDYLGQNGFYIEKLCQWIVMQETAIMRWYQTPEGQAQKAREVYETKKRLRLLDENTQMPGTESRDGAIDVEVIAHGQAALPPSEELEW